MVAASGSAALPLRSWRYGCICFLRALYGGSFGVTAVLSQRVASTACTAAAWEGRKD